MRLRGSQSVTKQMSWWDVWLCPGLRLSKYLGTLPPGQSYGPLMNHAEAYEGCRSVNRYHEVSTRLNLEVQLKEKKVFYTPTGR